MPELELNYLLIATAGVAVLWLLVTLAVLWTAGRGLPVFKRTILTVILGLFVLFFAVMTVPGRSAHLEKFSESFFAPEDPDAEVHEPSMFRTAMEIFESRMLDGALSAQFELERVGICSVGYWTGSKYGRIPVTFGLFNIVVDNFQRYAVTFDTPKVEVTVETKKARRFLRLRNCDDAATYTCTVYRNVLSDAGAGKENAIKPGKSLLVGKFSDMEKLKNFFSPGEMFCELDTDLADGDRFEFAFRRGMRLMQTLSLTVTGEELSGEWILPRK